MLRQISQLLSSDEFRLPQHARSHLCAHVAAPVLFPKISIMAASQGSSSENNKDFSVAVNLLRQATEILSRSSDTELKVLPVNPVLSVERIADQFSRTAQIYLTGERKRRLLNLESLFSVFSIYKYVVFYISEGMPTSQTWQSTNSLLQA